MLRSPINARQDSLDGAARELVFLRNEVERRRQTLRPGGVGYGTRSAEPLSEQGRETIRDQIRELLSKMAEPLKKAEPSDALFALRPLFERSLELSDELGGEPVGELFAPIALHPRFWETNGVLELRGSEALAIRILAESNLASVGLALASDDRFWRLRAISASARFDRFEDESFAAPADWARAAAPTSKSKKPQPSRSAADMEALAARVDRHMASAAEVWRVGFESGAIARLKGSPDGADLLARIIQEAPMERVEKAAAAGLDLSALTPESSARLLRSVALGADVELAAYNRERFERQYALGAAETRERDALASGSFERRAARWAKAIELKAPLARVSDQEDLFGSRGVESAQAIAALGAYAMEARRGGALRGPGAGAAWAAFEALCVFPKGADKALGELGLDGSSPLAYAFAKGAKASDFGNPGVWAALRRSVDLDASLGRACALGVSAKRWAERWGLKAAPVVGALLQGAQSPALMSLARMGARFENEKEDASVFILALENHRLWADRPKEFLEGFLSAAERASPGGSARAMASRGAQGEGPMCLAAKALSVPALELLMEKGGSLGETDGLGRGLGRWLSQRRSEIDTKKIQELIEWLSAKGFNWSAVDKSGASEASWLASRGSPERVMALIGHLPELKEELSRVALKRMKPSKAALMERALLAEQTERPASEEDSHKDKQPAPRGPKSRL